MAKKKALRLGAVMKQLLLLPPDEEHDKLLAAMGIKKSERTNAAAVMAAVLEKARKGEMSAVKQMLEIVGGIGTQADVDELSRLYAALDGDDS